MNVAIIICVAFTFYVDVELSHPPRIFSALVCFALFADSECHACDCGDGGDGEKANYHDAGDVAIVIEHSDIYDMGFCGQECAKLMYLLEAYGEA